MLIAAMILGLIGGITYFVGGGVGTIVLGEGADSAPWWVVSLIPIGALATMGAAIVRTKPNVAGYVLLLAAAGAIGVGFASCQEAMEYKAIDEVLNTIHPFGGPFMFVQVPLLSLFIGGMLALSSGKKTGADD
jgi:hypothetical protein